MGISLRRKCMRSCHSVSHVYMYERIRLFHSLFLSLTLSPRLLSETHKYTHNHNTIHKLTGLRGNCMSACHSVSRVYMYVRIRLFLFLSLSFCFFLNRQILTQHNTQTDRSTWKYKFKNNPKKQYTPLFKTPSRISTLLTL